MHYNATERAQGYLAAVRHALEETMRARDHSIPLPAPSVLMSGAHVEVAVR